MVFMDSRCNGGYRHKEVVVIQCDLGTDGGVRSVVGGTQMPTLKLWQVLRPLLLLKDSVVSARLEPLVVLYCIWIL